MIRRLIGKLLGRTRAEAPAAASGPPPLPLGRRVEIPAAEHGIDPALLDANAVRVVRTLKDAGFDAYIVGGAVRDLLVGLKPKDFDVATDATPEQVKQLFRRAFVIGRRFRLVHVIFGRGREHEVIEVSTFRAYLDPDAADAVPSNEKTSRAELQGRSHAVDASGRVLRDNVWGPQVEDAARRDFTVNAMYYDPLTHTLVDYHGGLPDARDRVLRMIGDPATRYREDPVRIVRVVRFAAKLGFGIEPATRAPVDALAPLLANVPVSRLFDEMVKLLQTGHAIASLAQLREVKLPRGVFPILDLVLAQTGRGDGADRFVQLALADTDRRVAEGKPVAPSFLLACLLWHEVQARWQALRADGTPPVPSLQQAVDAVFDARIGDISGRGKLGADMREIWTMQPRFERRTGRGPQSLVEVPRYRAGWDFLRLRADAGEVDAALVEWWEDFALGSDEDREAMIEAARESQPGRRSGSGDKGARRRRKAAGPAGGAASAHEAGGQAGAGATVSASGEAGPGRAGAQAAGRGDEDAAADGDDGTGAQDEEDAGGEGGEGGAAAPAARKPRKRRRRRRKPAGDSDAGAPSGDAAGAAAAATGSPDDDA
ncbi:MAG: polynucleotide adenylyltransferase PcnB [Burkholderiales bacterium]|nr:polynucleotide adenylyltransferase PcnB [Burkholderiales bacterium]